MVEKNERKQKNKENRSIFYQWNLGTRDMKSAKKPSRQERKRRDRKEIAE